MIEERGDIIKTGQSGEKTAAAYLKQNGYEVIERNFRCKAGEIDLILKKQNVLIFAEVKTRSSLKFGRPSESITKDKIRHIRKTAIWYIQFDSEQYRDLDIRFDVVEILRQEGQTYINHLEGAF